MLVVDVVSWIVLGIVIGGIWEYLARDRHVTPSGTLIFGTIGALVGGLPLIGSAIPGKYNVGALITSFLGAVAFLFVYSLISHRKSQQKPPLDLPTSPR